MYLKKYLEAKDDRFMMMTTESIWERFHMKLKQFILKHIPDKQSAEDVLQEVFLKIHAHIETLRDEEKLQSWIYQIARNAIADHYRVYTANVVLSEISPLLEEPADDIIGELSPCIRAMVDSLPDDYRQALFLTEYEGLTQRELGERLGLSFSGTKSRVQRARGKLKRMLLDCCHFEFDHSGRVIDYQPKCANCSEQSHPCGCR